MSEPPSADIALSRFSKILYLLLAISVGIESAFFLTEIPFLMRASGISLENVGWYSAAATLPYILQSFFNPITEFAMRRRSWFVIISTCCALSILFSLKCLSSHHQYLFYAAAMIGQILYGLACSCYSGLAATTLNSSGRLQASNLLSLGAQAGGAFGSTVFLAVTQRCSLGMLALLLLALIVLPALAALAIYEPKAGPQRPEILVGAIADEARQVMRNKESWLGLALCACPAGTLALNYFLPALAIDYHAPSWMTISLNGYAGWMITLAGIYIGGLACRRVYYPVVYMSSAVLMALTGLLFALMPVQAVSYAIGSVIYSAVQGASVAACSAMIFDLISQSKSSSSTQYSIFYGASSLAQMYVLSINTHVYGRHGLTALYTTDAALNLLGVVMLLVLMRRWLGKRKLFLAKTQVIARGCDV